MKFNWTQFAIAIGLFLLGYLTFNNPWFSSKPVEAPAASVPAPAASAPAPAASAPAPAASAPAPAAK